MKSVSCTTGLWKHLFLKPTSPKKESMVWTWLRKYAVFATVSYLMIFRGPSFLRLGRVFQHLRYISSQVNSLSLVSADLSESIHRLAFTASQLWASPGVWRQLWTVSQFFAVHVQVGMYEELATVHLWTKKLCRSCANVSPMHVRRCWLIFLVKLSLILKMGIKNTREICFILRDLSAL
jgi:transposase